MKKSLLNLFLILSISTVVSYSQVTNIGNFFAGGVDDAEELFEGYLSPYFNAFGASLTGGWYNTAKPHQLGGFDLTATINTAFVPSTDRSFDMNELTLQSLRLAAGADNITPTVAGDKKTGSQLVYVDPTGTTDGVNAFEMPKGTGVAYIPSPMLQLGLGLIKDTEIKGRYMPTFSSGDSKVDMWGIGFVHGLKQWIPFIKKVPVLHLSLQYGYTQMNSEIGLSVNPADIGATWSASSGTEPTWDNQKMEFVTESHTGNLLISANLPVVCFYGGIGFASTKTNLLLKGDYPAADMEQSAIEGSIVVTDAVYSTLNNPIDIEFRNSDGSKTKPRYNVGVRFKFAIITLHFDYTYANYSMATAGLGISFR